MEHGAFKDYIHFQVEYGPRLTDFYASGDYAHAKERLKAYSLKQRSEAKLIEAMKNRFGQGLQNHVFEKEKAFTTMLGDWNEGHTGKFQTSSKTSGWRKTFTAAKLP
ncbi:hypothetical protein HKX48_008041 [Thoreauomyces humboldtii]|nr:hypothetical protein HKX48_008041 [Thoreauomyces humboldtii]